MVAFLSHCARLLGPGGEMVIGADLKKNPAILNAAYNDAAGTNAAFNLNLLERINRELDGDLQGRPIRARRVLRGDAGAGWSSMSKA